MVVFDSFDKLKQHILKEIKKSDIRIVRFINVNSIEMWLQLLAFLRDISGMTLTLSEFCTEDDLTPNLNNLTNELKKVKKTTLMLPLSEHLRIVKRDETVLRRFLKLEFSSDTVGSNTRVFIPMYRMKGKLIQLSNEDKRFAENILSLDTSEDNDYSLTLVDTNINFNIKGTNIKGYKDYLKYWEQNPGTPIILHTQFANSYFDDVLSDNIKVLTNSFDILIHHYNLNNVLQESWGNDWQWNKLINLMKDNTSIIDTLKKLFLLPKFNAGVLISRWRGATDFEKWAIWLWAKLEAKNGYLALVLNDEQVTPESLIDGIVNGVFKIEITGINETKYKKQYIERREYLELMQISNLHSSFWDYLQERKPIEKLYYLTDCTDKERKEIINVIKNVKISDRTKSIIQFSFPVLYEYLQTYIFTEQEFTDYFEQYKVQKIENSINDSFAKLVKRYAESKGIWWGIESRNKLIDSVYNKKSVIYWIDALGVEYLSLVTYLLRTNFSSVHYKIQIGYSNLPTTTDRNNDFVNNRNVIEFRDLDKQKHSYNTEYPDYIINEFYLVEKALKEAVGSLSEYDNVIIASDHGASRLAVLYSGDTHKAQESSLVKKYGRFCIDNKSDYGSKIPGCIDQDEYHVMANYDRFASNGGPKGEIHGGASLEEVLVPVIHLSNKPFDVDIVIVTTLTSEIKIKAGLKPKVMFKLDKDFTKLDARILNKQYTCTKEDNHWYFEPDLDKGEEFTAKVIAEGRILGTVKFKIIKGISSNFDI